MKKSEIKMLKTIDTLIKSYLRTDGKLFDTFRDSYYEAHFNDWSCEQYELLQNTFFELITGEPDFDSFSDRFDAPGSAKGDKPVAWNTYFIPDQINWTIMSDSLSTKAKLKRVRELYSECTNAEAKFREKK